MDQTDINTGAGSCIDCGQATTWPCANRCAACAQIILASIWPDNNPNYQKDPGPTQDPSPLDNTESQEKPGHQALTQQTKAALPPTQDQTETPANPPALAPPETSAPSQSTKTPNIPDPGDTPQSTSPKNEPAPLEDLPLFR